MSILHSFCTILQVFFFITFQLKCIHRSICFIYKYRTKFFLNSKVEECLSVNHKTIDQWQRSTKNVVSAGRICDSDIENGWYRPNSKAGNLMPTKCVHGGFKCGTGKPIWMNGKFVFIHFVVLCFLLALLPFILSFFYHCFFNKYIFSFRQLVLYNLVQVFFVKRNMNTNK